MVKRLNRKSKQKMLLIDDFLPEGDLKYRLSNPSLWIKNKDWQWQDIDASEVNVFEEFLSYAWKEIYWNHMDGITGWEYWTQCIEQGIQLNFHVDDNSLDPDDLKGQPHKLSKFGLSYYAQKEIPNGGYLMIQRDNGEVERIQPKPNRLVIFDSATPHAVSVINEGYRSSLVSVAWDEKPWHYQDNNMSLHRW